MYLVLVNDVDIEVKEKWPQQPSSGLRRGGAQEWEDKGNMNMDHDTGSGAFSYENNVETAPPAYNSSLQFTGSRRPFGM